MENGFVGTLTSKVPVALRRRPAPMPGGPDSVPNRVSAAVMAGSVDARSLRCHANGFTARPNIPLGGGLLIIAIRIAWPFILAVCVGIEESAVARLLDYCLREYRRCGQARQHGHRAKKFEHRHLCFSAAGHELAAEQRITPELVRSSRNRRSLGREAVRVAPPAIYWRAPFRATGRPDPPRAAGEPCAGRAVRNRKEQFVRRRFVCRATLAALVRGPARHPPCRITQERAPCSGRRAGA